MRNLNDETLMSQYIESIEKKGRFKTYKKKMAQQIENDEFQRELDAERIAEHYSGQFRRMRSIVEMNIPEPVNLFGGWLNENEISLLHSYTGAGKSWFSMAVAVSVAGGGGFIGWESEKTSTVVYIDGELGLGALKSMALKMADFVGTDKELMANNLVMFSEEDGKDSNSDERFNLCDPLIQDMVIDMFEHNGVKLAVIDNIRTLFNLDDENSAQSWSMINDFLIRLRKYCAVLVVHHDNKSGDFSGSSNASTVVNTRIQLTSVEPTHNLIGCGAVFDIEFMKVRGLRGDAHQRKTVGLHPKDGWKVRFDRATNYLRVYELALTGEYTNQQQLAEQMGTNKSTISRLLRDFDPNGEVKRLLKNAKKVDDETGYFGDMPGLDDAFEND